MNISKIIQNKEKVVEVSERSNIKRLGNKCQNILSLEANKNKIGGEN